MQNVQGFLDLPIRKIYEAKLFKSYLFLCIHDTYNLNKKFFPKKHSKKCRKKLSYRSNQYKKCIYKNIFSGDPRIEPFVLCSMKWEEE